MIMKRAVLMALGCLLLVVAFVLPFLLWGGASKPSGSEQAAAEGGEGNRGGGTAGVMAPEVNPPQSGTPNGVGPVEVKGVKDAYAGKLPVGTAMELNRGLMPAELEAVAANFNMLRAENCMKPAPIHPTEETWNWDTPDRLVAYAQSNGMQVIGHTLVWHSQTAPWFFQGPGGGGSMVDRETLVARMKTHIQTVVGRYAGKVGYWNVVNEAIGDGAGAEGTENLRATSWLRILGPEYVTLAFKYAREADPSAKLYYNDYNIETGRKHASSMVLLKRLLAEGAPIDGVGIQGHWNAGRVPVEDLGKAIEDYTGLGLKVALTEMDITMGGGARPAGAPADSAELLAAQAEEYRKVMQVVMAHREAVSFVVFYNINDRRSWRSTQSPTLFDAQGMAKPAWQAVVDVGLGRAGVP
jgi:GH35 family endo-1,4-beta-xylanase